MVLTTFTRYLIIIFVFVVIILPKQSISLHYADENDSIDFIHPIDTLDSLMRFYNDAGVTFIYRGIYDSAEIYLQRSLEIKQKILSTNDRRIGNNHINLGVIYEKLWNFEQALMHFDEGIKIYNAIDSNFIHIGSAYVNKAVVFRKLQDYHKAIEHYNQAIRIFNRQNQIDYDKLSIVYLNLGIVYEHLGDYRNAIDHFNQSLLFDHSKNIYRQSTIYNGLALNYSYLGEINLSKKYYKLAIDLISDNYGKNDYRIADLYTNYGILLVESLNEYESGFEFYKRALQINKSFYRENNYNVIRCYNNIGDYYLLRSNIDSALFYFQIALKGLYPNQVSNSIKDNPQIDQIITNPKALNTLKLKAKALQLKHNENKDISILDLSLRTYLLVYELIDNIRLRYSNENTSFTISEKEDNTFISGIRIAQELYKLTQDSNYVKIAHHINEKRKGFSLLTSIRKIEAKEFGGIPLNLLNIENKLFKQIAAYEEMIYEEEKYSEPDINRLNLWKDKIFKLNQEHERLTRRFEIEYPRYYQLKYDVNVISIESVINSLNEYQALIEYALDDKQLTCICISKKKFDIYSYDIDSLNVDQIKILTTNLPHPNFSSGVRQAYRDYTEAAYELYKILIEPCRELIEGKSVTIIPDGILSYLPFEALLTAPVMNDEPDYRNLPYLVRDFNIGYSYSATLHFENQKRSGSSPKNLLAFAPDYSNMLAQLIPQPSYLELYRDQLVPLPGVKDEVKMISKQIKGDVFLDEMATESNFKRFAGNYDILHLAMHTIVDNENPMYSKLAFTQNVDSIDDGFLNTYEIYNMKYNARMTVLSSCKTGFGKLMKGEGVMSLARGFMYAGCPSIVMTLWEVSDKSGSHLMRDFYKYLKKGYTKTEALRHAKLDFLKTSDKLKSNPYFWSTYVAIGDASSLYPNRSVRIWIITTILLAGAATAIIIYLRSKKKKPVTLKITDKDTIYT